MTTPNKKRVLGRGLDAILQSQETDITSTDISGSYVAGAVAEIDIDLIETNPFQPRTDFDEKALQELSESIKTQGVIQPVTGERRLRASKMAGMKKIPVFIRVANDEQMLEMALIENIHREGLNAIEVALSYQRLLEECQLTQEQLSEKVGKDRSTVTNFLRLLKLPPEIQVALRDGFISMGHARALINIGDTTKQLLILKRVIEEDLNVRQVEKIARELVESQTVGKGVKKQSDYIPESFKKQIDNISKSLNMSVKLNRNNRGKGSITINFKNDEEFDKLINIISNNK